MASAETARAELGAHREAIPEDEEEEVEAKVDQIMKRSSMASVFQKRGPSFSVQSDFDNLSRHYSFAQSTRSRIGVWKNLAANDQRSASVVAGRGGLTSSMSLRSAKPPNLKNSKITSSVFDDYDDVEPPQTVIGKRKGSTFSTEYINVSVNNGLQNRRVMATNNVPLIYALFSSLLLVPNVLITGHYGWSIPGIFIHTATLLFALLIDFTDEAIYAGTGVCFWAPYLVGKDVHTSSMTHLNVKDKVTYNTILDYWLGIENHIGLVANYHGIYLVTGNVLLSLVTFGICIATKTDQAIWNMCNKNSNRQCEDGECDVNCTLLLIYQLALFSWSAFLYLSGLFLLSEISQFYFEDQVEYVEYGKIIRKYDSLGLKFRFNDLPLWNLSRRKINSQLNALTRVLSNNDIDLEGKVEIMRATSSDPTLVSGSQTAVVHETLGSQSAVETDDANNITLDDSSAVNPGISSSDSVFSTNKDKLVAIQSQEELPSGLMAASDQIRTSMMLQNEDLKFNDTPDHFRRQTLDDKTKKLAVEMSIEIEAGAVDIAEQAQMELLLASQANVMDDKKDAISNLTEEDLDEDLFRANMAQIADRKAKTLVKRLVRQNQAYEDIMERLDDFKASFQEEMNEFAVWYDRVGGVKQLLRAIRRKRRALIKRGMESPRFKFFALVCGAVAALSVWITEPKKLINNDRWLLVNGIYAACIPVIMYGVILVMRALHRARLLYEACTQLMKELDTPIDLTMDSMGSISSRHAIAKLACWWEVRQCFKNYRIFTTYNALNLAFSACVVIFLGVSVYLLLRIFVFGNNINQFSLDAVSLLFIVYFANNGYSLYMFLQIAAEMWRAQRDHLEMLAQEKMAMMYQSGTMDLLEQSMLEGLHNLGPQDSNQDGVISKEELGAWNDRSHTLNLSRGRLGIPESGHGQSDDAPTTSDEARKLRKELQDLADSELREVMNSVDQVAEFLDRYDQAPRILGIDVTDNALLAFQTYFASTVATVFIYFMFGDSLN